MKNNISKYTILIICEGKNTEPFYFRSIREKIEQEGIWENTSIVIIPKPLHDDEIVVDTSVHKTRRAQKVIKNNDIRIELEVEQEYKAQPTRYVREAQLEMGDGTYNEAWAVFDNDSRNVKHISAAFELADNEHEGKVNIAYSSIAFEHWYLLHFEKNKKSFTKSECRIGDDVLNCNSGEHEDDCYGNSCIGGYMRNRQYLNAGTKDKNSLFASLESRLNTAFVNASWLRYEMEKATPNEQYFVFNPYTNVDRIVKYLLKISTNFFWNALNKDVEINGTIIKLQRDNDILQIHIINTKRIAHIFNQQFLLNTDFNKEYTLSNLLVEGEKEKIQQTDLAQFPNAVYYYLVFENNHVFIALNDR